jgi:hypothetical protein
MSPKASGLFSAAIMESIPTPRMLGVSVAEVKDVLTRMQPHTMSTSPWKKRSRLRRTPSSMRPLVPMVLQTPKWLAFVHWARRFSRERTAWQIM